MLPKRRGRKSNLNFKSRHSLWCHTMWRLDQSFQKTDSKNITYNNTPLALYSTQELCVCTCVFPHLRIGSSCLWVCDCVLAGHGALRPLLLTAKQTMCTCLPGGRVKGRSSCSTTFSCHVWWGPRPHSYLDCRETSCQDFGVRNMCGTARLKAMNYEGPKQKVVGASQSCNLFKGPNNINL